MILFLSDVFLLFIFILFFIVNDQQCCFYVNSSFSFLKSKKQINNNVSYFRGYKRHLLFGYDSTNALFIPITTLV